MVEDHNGARQEFKTLIKLSIGDFVISQQNIIIEKVDKDYAQETINLLNDKGGI